METPLNQRLRSADKTFSTVTDLRIPRTTDFICKNRTEFDKRWKEGLYTEAMRNIEKRLTKRLNDDAEAVQWKKKLQEKGRK